MRDRDSQAVAGGRDGRQDGTLSASGYILVMLVIIGWGTAWPFLKIALSEIPPWTFRGLIAPTAAVFTFGIAFFLKQSVRIPRHQLGPLLLASGLNITLWHMLSAMGKPQMGFELTWDDKINPLVDTVFVNVNGLFIGHPVGIWKHNIVARKTVNPRSPNAGTTQEIKYTYNPWGYPVKMTTVKKGEEDVATMTYDCK